MSSWPMCFCTQSVSNNIINKDLQFSPDTISIQNNSYSWFYRESVGDQISVAKIMMKKLKAREHLREEITWDRKEEYIVEFTHRVLSNLWALVWYIVLYFNLHGYNIYILCQMCQPEQHRGPKVSPCITMSSIGVLSVNPNLVYQWEIIVINSSLPQVINIESRQCL